MSCSSDILIGYIASNLTWRLWSLDTRTLNVTEVAWNVRTAGNHRSAEDQMVTKANDLGYLAASVAIGEDLYVFCLNSTSHLLPEQR